jgi:protocatechuate 3,4-dioxygenase beta subunit
VNDGAAVDRELAVMLRSCTEARLWAEQDEGPYHRDDRPTRRDVVEDRDGVALQLGIRLAADDGTPVPDAGVEIWQCDALGRYSGFPPPQGTEVITAQPAGRPEYVEGQTFLRGGQATDDSGMVEFHTIYPGWYPGRTVHIHLMVRTGDAVLTSQLYFPDPLTDEVLAQAPYAARPGRDTTNEADTIFRTGGVPAIVDIIPTGPSYRAAISLVLPSRPGPS